ncbi:MAG: hypothetical protein M0C28_11525 [Candidatus Moduliflexus flocculans]|nr:hypothetical protein [Candidatus Moduliflexus flocculans]
MALIEQACDADRLRTKDMGPKIEKLIAEAAPKGEHEAPSARRRRRSSPREMKRDPASTARSRTKGLTLEVVPEPRRPQGLPGLLPLPRRQAPERARARRSACSARCATTCRRSTREGGEGSVPSTGRRHGG